MRMIRNLLRLSLAGLLLVGSPIAVEAAPSIEIIDTDLQPVTINLQESTLRVVGASGQMLYIYNVAGVRVKSIKVEGDDKRIELNLPKGCYIVKVGKTVRKISIR